MAPPVSVCQHPLSPSPMDNPTDRPKPPESLLDRLEFLEEENATLRRRLLVEEISDEVRDRVYRWLKGFGASAVAIAAALGLGSFAALFNIANKTATDVATKIAEEKASAVAIEEVVQRASDSIAEQFKDSDFQAQLLEATTVQLLADEDFIARVAQNSFNNEELQGRILTEVETTTKETLARTTQSVADEAEASQEETAVALAQAVELQVEKQLFYVILSSNKDQDLLTGMAQQAQEQGLKTRICPPKSGNEQSAIVIAPGEAETFLVAQEQAKEWEAIAQTLQANAYSLLEGRAFFDCKS